MQYLYSHNNIMLDRLNLSIYIVDLYGQIQVFKTAINVPTYCILFVGVPLICV